MRPIDGRHATAMLVGFFGVVIAVNVTMAVLASTTFGGTVVDNSYVASQEYNGWLEEARRERELAWSEEVARDGDRLSLAVTSAIGLPLEDATVRATATHPLGRMPPVELSFAENAAGRYLSREALPEGRWIVRFEIVQGARRKRLLVDLS